MNLISQSILIYIAKTLNENVSFKYRTFLIHAMYVNGFASLQMNCLISIYSEQM